ncbi:MAG: type VI secretion system baseplate subunit TssK [Bacteroidota bacterium]|nr:type VI secretion system baseplate subunit TssK [Bacteroidota bacterium]
MQENSYLPVNWIDGMKINKSHFIAQDNALLFHLVQTVSGVLNDLNYGLLPAGPDGKGLKLFLSSDNQQKIQVRMQSCRAVTAGGYYIEFTSDTALQGKNLQASLVSPSVGIKELKEKSAFYYVVLTINPYKRVPFGEANPAETPPRIPFTMPFYSLDLVAVGDITKNRLGSFQLPVGKIKIDDLRAQLDESYIPPCSTVTSHPDLLEIHAALEQFFAKMENYSLIIIQKIFQKKQTNEMSVIVHKLCEQVLFFTGTEVAELKSMGLIQAPVYIVSKICSLARVFKNTLDCYLGSGKEELVNYFIEWCSFTKGDLESAILSASNHQYDHLDINSSVEKVSVFTIIISNLFHQLARLEYIGKRKEAGIFVKEEVIAPSNQSSDPKKRRSFLAD